MTSEPTSVTAGRLCRHQPFQTFLGVPSERAAAIQLRYLCGVQSRRELDTNIRAKRRFHELRKQFAYGDAS